MSFHPEQPEEEKEAWCCLCSCACCGFCLLICVISHIFLYIYIGGVVSIVSTCSVACSGWTWNT